LNLTNVNGGAGFSVAGGGPSLNPFLADGSISIAAEPVPEPSSFALLALGTLALIAAKRRRK
jgi:hypothetical protein